MNKKLFRSLICISTIALLFSCYATKLESGLQKIELGMTKQDVISVLGKHYKISGLAGTPDGDLETWSYNIFASEMQEKIIINFLDGRLNEWHREYFPPQTAEKNNSSLYKKE